MVYLVLRDGALRTSPVTPKRNTTNASDMPFGGCLRVLSHLGDVPVQPHPLYGNSKTDFKFFLFKLNHDSHAK
jgi:hypothetical protein